MPPSPAGSTLLSRLRALLPARFRDRRPTVAVVRLNGAIGDVGPFRRGLSLAGCAPTLARAFALRGVQAVAITINSPGGSAVQSHFIYRRIRDLADEKGLPVLVFVEDVAASGGYMIACAGDEIFADPASLVGSIGVVYAGFGFDRFIARFGIERRVHTMGERKAMLDPFRPEDPADIARLEAIQADVHRLFGDLVRARRGAKLTTDQDLFTGAIWSGREGLALGLVDGLGDLRSVLRQRFGEKVRLRLVQPPRTSALGRLLRRPNASAGLDAADLIAALEERLVWGRWGL